MYARARPLPTQPAKPLWPWFLLALLVLGLGYWGYRVATQPRDVAVQASALKGTPAQNWAALKGRS